MEATLQGLPNIPVAVGTFSRAGALSSGAQALEKGEGFRRKCLTGLFWLQPTPKRSLAHAFAAGVWQGSRALDKIKKNQSKEAPTTEVKVKEYVSRSEVFCLF